MHELYFLVTFLTTVVLIITILIKSIRKKSIAKSLKTLSVVTILYLLLWSVSYFTSKLKPINLGEDICFDDWCATITSFERLENIGNQKATGRFFVLSVKMTNRARGISQKPSEPRIQIIDDRGNIWFVSTVGQKELEDLQGIQIPIDQRLELHQSLETKMVFDIPMGATGLKAIIKEGLQFMTNIILQDDKHVFKLK